MRLESAAWTLIVILVFSIPWDRSVHWGLAGTMTRAIGLAAFLIGLAAAAQRPKPHVRWNAALVFAGAFCFWSALSWLWTVDREATLSRAVTLGQLLAMTWLVWTFCDTGKRLSRLLMAFVSGSVVLSIMTLVRYGLGMQTYWRRYAAPGFDPNDTGVTIAIAMPVALYLAQACSGWRAWAWRAAMAVMIPAILVTASRTALAATFVAFIFSAWMWKRSTWAQRITSVVFIGLMALSLVKLAPAPARQRLQTLPTELTKGTLNKRTSIWKAGLSRFRERPFLGVGAGAYPTAVDPLLPPTTVKGHVNVAHNTFLSVLVECGIIGFAAFALMLLALLVFVWAMQGNHRALWATTLVVWAAGVSTVTWEHRKVTWLVFAFIMAAWALPLRERRIEPRIEQQ
jgi:O-antigen ligase